MSEKHKSEDSWNEAARQIIARLPEGFQASLALSILAHVDAITSERSWASQVERSIHIKNVHILLEEFGLPSLQKIAGIKRKDPEFYARQVSEIIPWEPREGELDWGRLAGLITARFHKAVKDDRVSCFSNVTVSGTLFNMLRDMHAGARQNRATVKELCHT